MSKSREIQFSKLLQSEEMATPLQWGDVIEIPIREHKLNESWSSKSDPELGLIRDSSQRRLKIKVGKEVHEVILKFEKNGSFVVRNLKTNRSVLYDPRRIQRVLGRESPFLYLQRPYSPIFGLKHFLHYHGRDYMNSSSDLSKVTVQRAGSTELHPFNFLSEDEQDWWLEDGDIITIPDTSSSE